MKEKELEKIFKALANRRRLAIISLLKNEKDLSVGGIAEKIKLSFKSTSKHLSILASVDIIVKEQKSSQVFYRIPQNPNEFIRKIISLI